MTHDNSDNLRSVLASLRYLIPTRPTSFHESLRLADLQASRLLELTGVNYAPVPSDVIRQLPRVRVVYRNIPTSGLSYWDGQAWLICLNRYEPRTRQRFTLFHEYKHIIDHGSTLRLYGGKGEVSADQQAEHAADYFAGCVLMPKRLAKRAYGEGLQRPAALARRFNISERAASVRLAQLGLRDDAARCSFIPMPRTTPREHYYRQPSPNRRLTHTLEEAL